MKLIAAAASLLADDTGATMVEYGLMLALISAVCLGALVPLGHEVNDAFETVGEFLESMLGG